MIDDQMGKEKKQLNFIPFTKQFCEVRKKFQTLKNLSLRYYYFLFIFVLTRFFIIKFLLNTIDSFLSILKFNVII